MLHKKRTWQIKNLEVPALATELLRCHSWTECTGFRAVGMLWLNDSTGADGAQEYAVVREEDGRQVESITVSWCTPAQLESKVVGIAARLPDMAPISDWVLQPDALEHGEGPCRFCA